MYTEFLRGNSSKITCKTGGDVRVEVSTTLTVKNNVLWDVASCSSWFTNKLHGATSQETAFFREGDSCVISKWILKK
jgi:hypothetical protein